MKNRKTYVLLLSILIVNLCFFIHNVSASSSVSVEWYRTWGGSNFDECGGITLDSSENIYIAGETESFGAGYKDMCLVKFDKFGVQQWNRTWGGNKFDRAKGVASDLLDNVYLAGHTASFGEYDHDMCLVKYDSSGVQQWNRTWGGSRDDCCYAIALDSSNNIYLTGFTHSYGAGSDDICLVKYDSSGVQQWNRTWGGSGNDKGFGVIIDSSNNIYIAGRTSSFGIENYNMCLVKYNTSGVQQWNYTLSGGGWEDICGITLDSFENIYLAGYTGRLAHPQDLCLIKITSSRILQWNKTWDGSEGIGCRAMALDSLDDIYLAGSKYVSEGHSGDMWLMKYTGSGKQWNKTWGGSQWDGCKAIILDSSDNIYLAGSTRSFGEGKSDICLVKIPNPSGIIIPGYNLILLISLICGVLVILIKKCYKLNVKYD